VWIERFPDYYPGTWTEFHPNFKNANKIKEREKVRNRISIDGTLKFGGNGKGSEYDLLEEFKDSGKLSFYVQEYNGTDYETTVGGYLLMAGDWDKTNKIVNITVETYNEYTNYDNAQDVEYGTEQLGIYEIPAYPVHKAVPQQKTWATKFSSKYQFSPIITDEIELMYGLEQIHKEDPIDILFDGNKDKIDYGEPWDGIYWSQAQYAPAGDPTPRLIFRFKEPRAIREIRLYADSRWDLKQGIIQFSDSNHAVIDSFSMAAKPADTNRVPHESIITPSNTIYNVKYINVTYNELTASDDYYYPLEYQFFADHEEIQKDVDVVKGDYNKYVGAKPLRLVLAEILNGHGESWEINDDGTDYIHFNDILNNKLSKLNFSFLGTELMNSLVIPTSSLIGGDNFPTYTPEDVFTLLGDIFHKYLTINGSITDTQKPSLVNGSVELIDIKNVDFSTVGLDLTNLEGRNWSANQSTVTINAAIKPRSIKYNQISKNNKFKTTVVKFDNATKFQDQKEVDMGLWQFDIEDVITRPDKYSSELILAKCNLNVSPTLYTGLTNNDTNLLLNGSTWTTTALTSFTLTNNSSSDIEIVSNTFVLSKLDTVRITNDISDTDIKLRIFDSKASYVGFGVTSVEGTYEFTTNTDSTDLKYIHLIIPPGTHEVHNFRIENVTYSVVETGGIENKDFSIYSLLNNYIAEMPHSTANFNGKTGVSVHKSPDEVIRDIVFPLKPTSLSVDLDKSYKTDLGINQPIKTSRLMDGGSRVKIQGYLFNSQK